VRCVLLICSAAEAENGTRISILGEPRVMRQRRKNGRCARRFLCKVCLFSIHYPNTAPAARVLITLCRLCSAGCEAVGEREREAIIGGSRGISADLAFCRSYTHIYYGGVRSSFWPIGFSKCVNLLLWFQICSSTRLVIRAANFNVYVASFSCR
jgi:hypothetical protein